MTKIILLCSLLALSQAAVAADTDVAPAAPAPAATRGSAPSGGLKTDEQKALYTLGYILGAKFLPPFTLSASELKTVELGMSDSVLHKPAKVDINQYGPKVNDLGKEREAKFAAKEQAAMAKEQAKAAKQAGPRKQKEKAFIAQQEKLKGAQVSKSGLIYFDVRVGTGTHPTADDTVLCNYEGTLIDGTVFDSSYKRGEPTEFPLNHVIPCWTEGIQKMRVGGKAKLVCPSNIAYGDRGAPPSIPGGATLIFDVELLAVKK